MKTVIARLLQTSIPKDLDIHVWMDEWIDRRTSKWMDGRTDEQIDGWIDRLMNVLIHV